MDSSARPPVRCRPGSNPVRILRGYLFRTILGTTALVLAVLLSLGAFIEFIGQLDDIEGRHGGRTLRLVISAFVYHLPRAPGELVLNHEVESALWFPLRSLVDPAHHVEYPTPNGGYPGILVGEPDRHVVWGLTYRFLEILFDSLGRPLPDRWDPATWTRPE